MKPPYNDEIHFDTDEPEPNYFAIIPADVRYDRRLSPRAILVYGELIALCGRRGYSWPSNAYFAKLYDVHKQAVSTWLRELAAAGHIRMEHPVGGRRRIYPLRKIGTPIPENQMPPAGKPDGLLIRKNDKEKRKEANVSVDFADPELQAEWEAFQTHRRQKGDPLTQISRGRAVAKLSTWGKTKAIAALRASIEHGWTGVFEPKPERQAQQAKVKLPINLRNKRINELNQRKAYWTRQPESKKRSMELEQIRIQLFNL